MDVYVVDVGSSDHFSVPVSSVMTGDSDRMAKTMRSIGQARVVG